MALAFPVALCAGHALGALASVGAQTRLLWTQLAGLAAAIAVGLLFGPMEEGLGFAFASLSTAIALWAVAHCFAARRELAPPPVRLALKPAAVALAACLAALFTDSGPWFSLTWLAAYALAAPLVDRQLLRDLSALGRLSPGLAPAQRR